MNTLTLTETFRVRFSALLLIATVLLASCQTAPVDGFVYGVAPTTVVQGIEWFKAGRSGTFAMQNAAKDLYLFGWAFKDGWMWFAMDASKREVLADVSQIMSGGNFASVKTFEDLVATLGNCGFKPMPRDAMPTWLAAELSAASAWVKGLSQLAVSSVTFAVMPAYNPSFEIVFGEAGDL